MMSQKNININSEEMAEDPDLRIFFEEFNWNTNEYEEENSIILKKSEMKRYMNTNNNSKKFTRMEKV